MTAALLERPLTQYRASYKHYRPASSPRPPSPGASLSAVTWGRSGEAVGRRRRGLEAGLAAHDARPSRGITLHRARLGILEGGHSGACVGGGGLSLALALKRRWVDAEAVLGGHIRPIQAEK